MRNYLLTEAWPEDLPDQVADRWREKARAYARDFPRAAWCVVPLSGQMAIVSQHYVERKPETPVFLQIRMQKGSS